MAINLIKGQRVEIESGLTRLKVEMGWKVNPNADPAYDLDASTFLLGSNGQIENEYDFVFYGSPNTIEVNGEVRPCSVDKSVLGSVDDLGDHHKAHTTRCNNQCSVGIQNVEKRLWFQKSFTLKYNGTNVHYKKYYNGNCKQQIGIRHTGKPA